MKNIYLLFKDITKSDKSAFLCKTPFAFSAGYCYNMNAVLQRMRKSEFSVLRILFLRFYGKVCELMEAQHNSFLETAGVGRLMGKYAVPCIISLLVAALYNIVDQIFIANADYLMFTEQWPIFPWVEK